MRHDKRGPYGAKQIGAPLTLQMRRRGRLHKTRHLIRRPPRPARARGERAEFARIPFGSSKVVKTSPSTPASERDGP
ncbi:hypothetical protein EVAR_69152_1 [Eumeta japonica]|uniref:Uncharacterized protein n=1 Tax=Eumeta variegata TaxID=151549 RepID=A0A4C1SMU6_EUMVA|nr:hypothetical protein EVAR_69152_1 [Eumeta japonica]